MKIIFERIPDVLQIILYVCVEFTFCGMFVNTFTFLLPFGMKFNFHSNSYNVSLYCSVIRCVHPTPGTFYLPLQLTPPFDKSIDLNYIFFHCCFGCELNFYLDPLNRIRFLYCQYIYFPSTIMCWNDRDSRNTEHLSHSISSITCTSFQIASKSTEESKKSFVRKMFHVISFENSFFLDQTEFVKGI